jgi:hypothetical protein
MILSIMVVQYLPEGTQREGMSSSAGGGGGAFYLSRNLVPITAMQHNTKCKFIY